MNNKQPTIIKVRKGINGAKYSACDEKGCFIRNFAKLADVRKHWKNEIKWGQVVLARELDKMPDMSRINATIKAIDRTLTAYGEEQKRKCEIALKSAQIDVLGSQATRWKHCEEKTRCKVKFEAFLVVHLHCLPPCIIIWCAIAPSQIGTIS